MEIVLDRLVSVLGYAMMVGKAVESSIVTHIQGAKLREEAKKSSKRC